MNIMKARFVVVTPMFLGESPLDDKSIGTANTIRGASVKGALRAQFRALNWSRIRKACKDNNAALNQLHKEEAAIFGSAVKDSKGGQAAFLLRIKGEEIKLVRELAGRTPEIEYLLGMGLYHFRDGMQRDHISAGGKFELELALKPSLSTEQIQQIKNTLLAFGLLGGLGSRARKGFGSVSITSLEVNGQAEKLPTNTSEYAAAIKKLVGELDANEPPLTAFSKLTKLQISATEKSAMGLLKKHGQEMGMYRGYGNNSGGGHKIFKNKSFEGFNAEKNFKLDHDWAYSITKERKKIEKLPERAVFGLPHPYGLNQQKYKVDIDVEGNKRRASPLFAHVHKLSNGYFLLVHTIFRSTFLPTSVGVQVVAKEKIDEKKYRTLAKNTFNNVIVDWPVIDRFLARFNPKTEDVIYG